MEEIILNIFLFVIIGVAGICLFLFVAEIISVIQYHKTFDKGKKIIDEVVHQIKATR